MVQLAAGLPWRSGVSKDTLPCEMGVRDFLEYYLAVFDAEAGTGFVYCCSSLKSGFLFTCSEHKIENFNLRLEVF